MQKAVWSVSVLVVGLAVGGYLVRSSERAAPVRWRTVPVERGSVVRVVTATGMVNPVVAVPVGSQVSGMIQSLHADFNSAVKAGDVVARIDPAPFQKRRDQATANLAIAKANVLKTRADLVQRKRELDRAGVLLRQQFVSQNEVDVAETAHQGAMSQLEMAEAQVKQAEAALSTAELDLKYTVIRSPVDGIVIARNVEVGQTVAASFATPNLFLIALDLTRMQVDTNVSEADIGGITEGKEAIFTVDAYPGERFHGQVHQVRNAPISVQNVVTYNVVAGVDNKDLRLKPGMTANVSIIVAHKDQVLMVSNAALRFTPPQAHYAGKPALGSGAGPVQADSGHGAPSSSATSVWKVGTSGQLVPVPIQTGISDGSTTEVQSGELKEGEPVVVGIEMPPTGHKPGALPPGFGTRQPTGHGSRDRGL
jgi:HlyD family secretion protein